MSIRLTADSAPARNRHPKLHFTGWPLAPSASASSDHRSHLWFGAHVTSDRSVTFRDEMSCTKFKFHWLGFEPLKKYHKTARMISSWNYWVGYSTFHARSNVVFATTIISRHAFPHSTQQWFNLLKHSNGTQQHSSFCWNGRRHSRLSRLPVWFKVEQLLSKVEPRL